MNIKLTEAEAHFLILKALGLDDERSRLSIHASGVTMLSTPHKVEIVNGIIITRAPSEEIPDDFFRVEPADV